jgi:hypothetical protein
MNGSQDVLNVLLVIINSEVIVFYVQMAIIIWLKVRQPAKLA